MRCRFQNNLISCLNVKNCACCIVNKIKLYILVHGSNSKSVSCKLSWVEFRKFAEHAQLFLDRSIYWISILDFHTGSNILDFHIESPYWIFILDFHIGFPYWISILNPTYWIHHIRFQYWTSIMDFHIGFPYWISILDSPYWISILDFHIGFHIGFL